MCWFVRFPFTVQLCAIWVRKLCLYTCTCWFVRLLCTTLALIFRTYGDELVAELRWSALDAHCTRACPGCVVCVVEALGRFPPCNVVDGSSENGPFCRPMRRENKFRRFRLRHVELTTMHRGYGCMWRVHGEDCPRLGLTCR